MRIRLTLLAIVALAALAWIAIDRGLIAGGRLEQPASAQAANKSAAPEIDVERSTASTATSAHATPSTTTAAAPASAEADSAAEQPTAESRASEKPGSRLAALERGARAGDRKAARGWAEAVMECGAAAYGDEVNANPSHVSHLNWSLVEQRFELRAELLGSLVQECRLLFPETDEARAMLHWRSMVYEALELWAASGDPYGQLLNAHRERTWPPPLDVWRTQQALAVAHLDPGDPQTLVDLGEAFAEGSRFMGEAWTLAACDLGYDCAAGGALQRRMCLSQMFCFEGSYEEVSLRLFSPRQWQIVQAQRRELLAMLQRGELAATFDVPPPGP
jgi:hypothetical protein